MSQIQGAHSGKVVIIDYGSQVTQLIARRTREAGVYSEIRSCLTPVAKILGNNPAAIILSGGPASVMEPDAPKLAPAILQAGIPILGICYGMQLLATNLGGKLKCSNKREYGPAKLNLIAPSPLWDGLDASIPSLVWMSHGDTVQEAPKGFTVTGATDSVAIAAIANENERIYGLQFHPEVHHSADGRRMLENFLFKVAKIVPSWNMNSFIEESIAAIRKQVGNGHVICALSGGVDSAVAAALIHKAIGKQLHCVFVDNGLLRLNEAELVISTLKEHFDLDITAVNASALFLERLKGVEDPEKKRKIIGHTFIEVFNREAGRLPKVDFLAQGTLYPDVIESISPKGPSAVIKSHHNVGGLPSSMKLQLVEPLRELFKDEVRKVGIELNIPEEIIWRQPFPGPGLAIRILGEVTKERLDVLRQTDKIAREELRAQGYERKIWQGFTVLLPVRAVGVMGDARTYENVIALRCVDSVDAMTADWSRLPYELLATISSRIINEVQGVNRVVYDISSKPPATIEWE